ncbi:polymorphic toxin-type HINT domain-containing protein [Streptomyces sp. enrichment culture]|uniref:polymorphic toxin-type HINT domain-containing protein n=1 Tax=Streptomyces sp. enrichment culture TaxID=1795815 RepID=UPI003F554A1A
MRRAVVAAAGAAVLVGLLPTAATAVPPVPPDDEPGREAVLLESLDKVVPADGSPVNEDIESLKIDAPQDRETAPPGTDVPLPASTSTVTFPSGAARTLSAAVESQSSDQVPVTLAPAEGQPTPTGTWGVTVDARPAVTTQGVDGAVIRVDPPDTGAVPVSLSLDYGTFENLYGADWGSRLRLVQFPACYLTTPDVEECQAYTELETVNDLATNTVSATVDPAADDIAATESEGTSVQSAGSRLLGAEGSGDSTVVGAVDSGAGPGGSFKATPLASTGSWSHAGSSGAFVWSYPLTVPAAPAGPTPNVALTYNSQSVDGRTGVSSPQASWIGEGWDYDPGHIERRYRSCKDDRKTLDAGAPNNTAKANKTSDLCWVSHNAVMSLAGRSTELVRVGTTNTYRPASDDGSRVTLKTGATNGDNDGEYWEVTTTDGTVYTFGRHEVGGGHADTNSVSTVPVFGNHPGEPCHATAFADSRCGAGKQQAWRWGLDKVADVHGNVMVVNWKQETNYYAVRDKRKTPEAYERFAYPTTIDYGMRSGDLSKPSAQVSFGVKQRCLKSTTACDAANFAKTDDPGAYRPWWDTPGNLNCKSTSKLCPGFPSFWTQMRLDTVTTLGARPGVTGLGKVDVYALHQSFPSDWYDTSPGLWLNSITRTGFGPGDTTGTLQSKDGVSFAEYRVGSSSPLQSRLRDRQLPNLVRTGPKDQRPAFTRPRIGTVATEAGADIEIEYTGGCATPPAEDKEKANGTCFPVRWSPDGDERTPPKVWFNKYVVASVVETDKVTNHGVPIVTKYKYTGPAWAKSDDEFQRPALRTYSDWRGYRQLSVTKGSKTTSSDTGNDDPQSQSYSETRYFVGTGGEVKDTTGTYTLVSDDAPQYAGQVAEALTYKDSDKHLVRRTLNFPWSKQTASRTREAEDGSAMEPLLAHRVGIKRTDDIQSLNPGWQSKRTLTSVDDTYGLPTEIESFVVKPDGSGGETLSEQECTRNAYVHNTDAHLIGLISQSRTIAVPCAQYADANPATHLLKSVRTSYDNLAHAATPLKGLTTTVAESNGEGDAHSVVTTTTYDPLGRVRKVTRPDQGTTENVYTPADIGGPLTGLKTINALGHSTTSTFDPGRSLPLTVTDPNGRVTRYEYDALGRLVKGWSPTRSSGSQTPDVQIGYQQASATPSRTSPAAVTTKTIRDDGSYASSVTIYDGLLRPVQTQNEAHGPGRIITDTSYDDHGRPSIVTSGYLAAGQPTTTLFEPKSTKLIPSYLKTQYDGMGRTIRQATYYDGEFEHETFTSYGPDTTHVNPPGNTSPATWTTTDALGRVTEVEQYTDAGQSTTRSTRYAYDVRGNRSEVTDPAGNKWTYKYDVRGRVVEATDPDTGTTRTTAFDGADRPLVTVDANGKSLYTSYDVLGRVTAVREGSATAAPIKSFTYDAVGALGMPVTSTRHTADGDYVSRIIGYTADYQPTGRDITIPANTKTAGLSGTYSYTYGYTPTGKPSSVTFPAKGGIAAEKVVTRYNEDGLPESTAGSSWYTADVTYSPFGGVLRAVSGSQPYRVWTSNFIDPHTGRLQRTVADRETASPHRITDSYYSYDASGTITSNSRKLSEASGSTWDTQCYTYDALGELVHAWTSNVVPTGTGNGCKTANGATFGYRTDYAASSGPVADAPNEAGDTSSPDASLTSTLAAAAPAAGTVAASATAYRQAFTYDWIGNRSTLTEHNVTDATKNVTYRSSYGTTAGNGATQPVMTQPHTLAWVSSTPSGSGSAYAYDAAGNTTKRDLANDTQHFVWTSENKPATVTAGGTTVNYTYDTEGQRLLENSSAGSTLYLPGGELTTDSTGKITKATRTYAHPGAPAVVRTSNGTSSGHTRNVQLTDHLGTATTSIQIALNQPVTRRAFKPFGEARGPKPASWPDRRSYLGTGVDDAATGLTHIGAREYDQANGRFISADPLLDITDPLQMNGYSYAKNSPISTSDPDGLKPVTDCYRGCSDGPDGLYRDWMVPDGSGGWKYEGAVYTYDVVGDLHSVYRFGGHHPPMGTRTVIKPYDTKAQKNSFKFVASLVIPDVESWKKVVSGEANGWDYLGITTDLPFVKVLKLVPDSVVKKGKGAIEDWLRKYNAPDCKCFLAGTEVLMADGETKKIEKIKVGDEVVATDPETGETGLRKVTRLIVTEDDKHFNELTVETPNGRERLTATHEHPFWVPEIGAWVEARNLAAGMTLRTPDGTTIRVLSNRAYTKHARTYNLTVDDLHTYYVLAGATPVLVHNSNCPLTGGFKSGVTPDEITDINRGFGGETLLSGSPANTMANASRYNSFWDKSAVVIRDIAGSHMFNNGNKRTAQAVVEELMRRNRVTSGPTSADLRSVIDRVGKGQLHDVSDISAALRGY